MGSSNDTQTGDVRSLVVAHLPDYKIDSVTLLGEGQDNIAYEVNADLIVRFNKESDPQVRAAQVDAEARLLAAVADISPVPVPEPSFTVAERGCLAYFKVPGLPLINLPVARRRAHTGPVATVLGQLLDTLHAVPVERFAGLVDVDNQPMTLWLDEAAQTYESIVDEVPRPHRAAVELFLAASPPTDQHNLVFSHNDLGIEHVLVEPDSGTVTGVIDWSDAAITDAACDFGLIYRDLGPTALDTALHNYRTGSHDLRSIRTRADFYAKCSVLEDLAYGLETGHHQYLDTSLTALTWLYPLGAH
ncbi:phosphotransferase family protein [Nocardia sp. NPDC004278]